MGVLCSNGLFGFMQFCGHILKGNRLNITRKTVAFRSRVDDKLSSGRKVCAGGMKTPLQFGAKAALDLDGP